MVPSVLVMVLGAVLVVSIWFLIVWAIVRYSVMLIVPGFVFSETVVGRLAFIMVVAVVLVLFIFRIAVVSKCRNVAWFTCMPLMVMSVGSVLVISR